MSSIDKRTDKSVCNYCNPIDLFMQRRFRNCKLLNKQPSRVHHLSEGAEVDRRYIILRNFRCLLACYRKLKAIAIFLVTGEIKISSTAMLRTNTENRICQLLLYFVIILLLVMRGGCNLIPTLSDNCTCVTSKGTYSLYPLQRTGRKPRFTESGFPPHKDYTYTYNPCVPYNFMSSQGNCTNVALCKYNTDGDPPDYINIGEQKEVMCDISRDGKIALLYPVHKYNPDIPGPVSRVTLECNNNSQAAPKFTLTNEADMTFLLTSYCGCPNKCLPPSSTTPSQPGPFSGTTPSSRPGTPSSSGSKDLIWELKILLPSLLGALVVVICIVCFRKRMSVIQRVQRYICCHCYGHNSDLPRDERNVFVTEKSALISHENDRAVEHDYPGVKGKLNEPVQEEDRDVKEENEFPGKDRRTVVV